jgi:hypothetical protein
MLIDLPSNPTQWTGLMAFGVASWAALRAARRKAVPSDPAVTTWHWVGALQFLYVLEIWLSTRHLAHDMADAVLRAAGLYADRSSIQIMLLVITVLTGMVAGIAMWQSHWWSRQTNVHAKLAWVCTVAILMLFLIETISLHAIDRVLYRPVGPVLFIAYAWVANAIAVTWLARRPAA